MRFALDRHVARPPVDRIITTRTPHAKRFTTPNVERTTQEEEENEVANEFADEDEVRPEPAEQEENVALTSRSDHGPKDTPVGCVCLRFARALLRLVFMVIAIIPIVIAIIGLLLWALTNGKLSEAGKILFFCGVFVTTWVFAGKTLRI